MSPSRYTRWGLQRLHENQHGRMTVLTSFVHGTLGPQAGTIWVDLTSKKNQPFKVIELMPDKALLIEYHDRRDVLALDEFFAKVERQELMFMGVTANQPISITSDGVR